MYILKIQFYLCSDLQYIYKAKRSVWKEFSPARDGTFINESVKKLPTMNSKNRAFDQCVFSLHKPTETFWQL